MLKCPLPDKIDSTNPGADLSEFQFTTEANLHWPIICQLLPHFLSMDSPNDVYSIHNAGWVELIQKVRAWNSKFTNEEYPKVEPLKYSKT